MGLVLYAKIRKSFWYLFAVCVLKFAFNVVKRELGGFIFPATSIKGKSIGFPWVSFFN